MAACCRLRVGGSVRGPSLGRAQAAGYRRRGFHSPCLTSPRSSARKEKAADMLSVVIMRGSASVHVCSSETAALRREQSRPRPSESAGSHTLLAVPLRTPPRQLALTAAARTLGPRGGAHWLTLRDGRRNAAAHAGRTWPHGCRAAHAHAHLTRCQRTPRAHPRTRVSPARHLPPRARRRPPRTPGTPVTHTFRPSLFLDPIFGHHTNASN